METNESPDVLFKDEAQNVVSKSDYTFNDALSALNRSYTYYLDIGEDESSAVDEAKAMVAEALYSPTKGEFEDLRSIVDYMLFAIQHRVPGRR